jgi:hypothetical protein
MTSDERTRQFALGVLRDAGLDGGDAETAVRALMDAGLLVGLPFVTPTFKALLGEYCRVAEAGLHRRLPLRWVMCRETHQAIARLAGNRVAPIMPKLAFVWSDDDAATMDPPMAVPIASASRLFDIPIRIDPAARAPMWEVPE